MVVYLFMAHSVSFSNNTALCWEIISQVNTYFLHHKPIENISALWQHELFQSLYSVTFHHCLRPWNKSVWTCLGNWQVINKNCSHIILLLHDQHPFLMQVTYCIVSFKRCVHVKPEISHSTSPLTAAAAIRFTANFGTKRSNFKLVVIL